MPQSDVEAVPTRQFPTYDQLPYSDFLKNHLIPNTPFLLSAKATQHWPCTSWRQPNDQAGPSKPYLQDLRRYGEELVPVANTLQREFSEFERDERPLSEVLDLWETGKGDGLYVKDWHLFEGIEGKGEGVGTVYTVPECFRDDWLNPSFTSDCRPSAQQTTNGDFRFCYLGPAGTFTPLHRDVYASYSWSANVVGRKLWWFFPPDALDPVKDRNGELVFDVRELEGEGGGIKVLQEEGEVIFVPSGWHHQVLNLDSCISINHNFFSSATLNSVFDALDAAQARVEESIADVKEMIQQRLGMDGPWQREWADEVQGLLERDAGWGWYGFWTTVKRNVLDPPAPAELSPDVSMRDSLVKAIVQRYKRRAEWQLLEDVQPIVCDVEKAIGDLS